MVLVETRFKPFSVKVPVLSVRLPVVRVIPFGTAEPKVWTAFPIVSLKPVLLIVLPAKLEVESGVITFMPA